MPKKLFYILIFFLCFVLIGNAGVLAEETGQQKLLGGLGTTVKKAKLGGEKAPVSLSFLIGQIISIILGFLGVIFLVLVIYGGFLWMNSSGNDEQISKAKNIMVSAVIGLSIIFAAYVITARVSGLFAEKAGLKEAEPAASTK
ncbi:MAG: hypothetical protein V1860_01985 [bacterium]